MKTMTRISIVTLVFIPLLGSAQVPIDPNQPTNYPPDPWCAAKGAPYKISLNTPPTPPTVHLSPAATEIEKQFLQGLMALPASTGLDQLEQTANYINKKAPQMGGSGMTNYVYMGNSLKHAADVYCTDRVKNTHNFYAVVPQVRSDYINQAISLEQSYIPVLHKSAQDCYDFQQKYKDFKDINYPIYEDKEKKGEELGNILQSCLNFTQQFVRQPVLYKR